MVGWKLLRHRFPSARFVVIRRPVADVITSIQRLGFGFDASVIVARDLMLDALAHAPGVVSIDYADLDQESVARQLFCGLLGERWDAGWWNDLKDCNIQIDLKARFNELVANREAIGRFNAEVVTESAKLGGAQCLGLN
jgi:hypothetical protein